MTTLANRQALLHHLIYNVVNGRSEIDVYRYISHKIKWLPTGEDILALQL